jgi:hypothetical protein
VPFLQGIGDHPALDLNAIPMRKAPKF